MIDTAYIEEFMDRLAVVCNERDDFSRNHPYLISVEYGRKFARIVQDHGHQRFVHCFIDITNGDVIKSAGWKAPQKDKDGLAVRYNLLDSISREECYRKMDPHGGYLYKR